MPYELPSTQLNNYQALTTEEPNKPVEIIYNGSGIHKITGATPFINFNRVSNVDENGTLNSTTVNIVLEGNIVRNGVDTGLSPPGTGLTNIMGAISNLEELFSSPWSDHSSYNNVLDVKCDNVSIYTISGVRLQNLDFTKTQDNWIQTAGFSAKLQYIDIPIKNTGSGYIKTSDDSWSIEPLEDYQFVNTSEPVTITSSETHNPNLGPTAPTPTAPQPGQGLGGGDFGGSNSVTVTQIPRFKINRTITANGVPTGTGNSATYSAYLNAKDWVESRASTAFLNDSTVLPALSSTTSSVDQFDKGTFLYNHLRTVNFSINAGSYSINDTWLAMPSSVSYLEEYQVETSTDANHIKSVTVAGEIRGLKVSNLSSLTSMTSGSTYVSGAADPGINLTIANGSTSDASTGPITSDGSISDVELSADRYGIAKSGWIEDIKPYMYRRASAFLGSNERVVDYYQPTNNSNGRNPIYAKEHPLNVIPVSTSETHDVRLGVIRYDYQYNNRFSFLSGVLSENLSVDVKGPADVVAEAFVLGRRLGPVIQNLGSRTSTEQTATLEIAVVPPSSIDGVVRTSNKCPLYHEGELYNSIEILFEGLQPYGDRPTTFFGNFDQRTNVEDDSGQVYIKRDDETWNASQGRFSKTVTWLYQACSNTREHLDN